MHHNDDNSTMAITRALHTYGSTDAAGALHLQSRKAVQNGHVVQVQQELPTTQDD